jgi:hypothetical protein
VHVRSVSHTNKQHFVSVLCSNTQNSLALTSCTLRLPVSSFTVERFSKAINVVVKPEALDAFATQSIRPRALDAAAANQGETDQNKSESKMTEQENVRSIIW